MQRYQTGDVSMSTLSSTSDLEEFLVLLADIGATNCRLAMFDPARKRFVDRMICSTDDFSSPREAITAFLAKGIESRPKAAALAIAGPVKGDIARLTNSGWRFDRSELMRSLDLPKLILINDLVAQASAVASVGPARLVGIGPLESAVLTHPTIVVGPGTGLGIARIDGSHQPRPAASEGGHVGFSPNDDVEMELLRLWRQDLGHVTNEHVVSGPGIVRIYRALGALQDRDIDPIDGSAIVQRSLTGEDALCVDTAERFAKILGAVAGDAALMAYASTVVLVGAIANSLAPILRRGGFRSRFEERGPGGAFLQDVPTLLATEQDLGLLGAYQLLRAT